MKKVLVVSDSFKESLSSKEVANAIEEGMKKYASQVQVVKIPVADGGEGTVEAMLEAIKGEKIHKQVTGPLGEPIKSFYGFSKEKQRAVIEVAATTGLSFVPLEKRDPSKTTSYGVGELILDAIEKGSRQIIVGLGGSATNDAGAGMLTALGCQFINSKGEAFCPVGGTLDEVVAIDTSKMIQRIEGIEFILASDVTNPLLGELGCARIFSMQKGATPEMVEMLEEKMTLYAKKLDRSVNKEISAMQGAGAAGGLGAAFLAYFNPIFKLGIDIILEANEMDTLIQSVDLVITGEGRIDAQTAYGKTPMGITALANKYQRKVIGIAGKVDTGAEVMLEKGMDHIYCVTPEGMALEDAFKKAYENVVAICEVIAQDYML